MRALRMLYGDDGFICKSDGPRPTQACRAVRGWSQRLFFAAVGPAKRNGAQQTERPHLQKRHSRVVLRRQVGEASKGTIPCIYAVVCIAAKRFCRQFGLAHKPT